MKTFAALLSLTAVMGLALTTGSFAHTRSTPWSAKLTAAQEIPKQVVENTAASGTFTGTLSGSNLKFRLTFAKLTGPATAAHIHFGATGRSGSVLAALCAPCKSPVTGTIKVGTGILQSGVQLEDFKKHLLYVNIHTAKNPNGEIRGQLGS